MILIDDGNTTFFSLFHFWYVSRLAIVVIINCRYLYREFSRLVYGTFGNRGIPLPAYAYMGIRMEFLVGKDENITEFDLDEGD